MNEQTQANNQAAPGLPLSDPHWRGLGGWNYYFLLKLGLFWYGYLNFHPFANLVLVAFLLFPITNDTLHRLRHWLALPAGMALFYHDTWLPGISSLISQGDQLAGLSRTYQLELVQRFINWHMLGAAFVLWVAYLFLAQWIRFTILVVLVLAWLNVQTVSDSALAFAPRAETPPAQQTAVLPVAPAVTDSGSEQKLAPTTQNINAALERFYQQEQQRQTRFPESLAPDAIPFDVLVINICSLSWSDLNAVDLASHPLWQRFDILLQQFNSATSYSGPAGIRLLRASCGQSSQQDLYRPAAEQCYLFDNLAHLGFSTQLAMDHTGEFGHYLTDLRQHGKLAAPLISQQGLPHSLVSFDGKPVLDDQQLFGRWLQQRGTDTTERSVTFFNLISLHDGNRVPGQNDTAPYRDRARLLLDELDGFFDVLAQSDRKLMVLVVPEHGAGLVGDKVQLSGLRDIPSPAITQVPVGVKFFGLQAPRQGPALEVNTPSSYLAVSELIARSVNGRLFAADQPDWSALVQALPQTDLVSENENAVVMAFQGKNYIRLNKGDWVLYPN